MRVLGQVKTKDKSCPRQARPPFHTYPLTSPRTLILQLILQRQARKSHVIFFFFFEKIITY